MSTKLFGKLATGVALGSAALLISAPGVAFADDKVDPKLDPKHKAAETESGIEQSEKSAFNTAQNNESQNKVIAKADRTAVAVNVPIQINSIALFGHGLLGGDLTCVNGVSDQTLESASEIESLGEAAEFLQRLDSECNGHHDGKKDDGKHDGKKDDGKKDDGKRDGKKDDGKRDGKKDDGKRDGKHDGKKDDGKRDGKKDDGKRDGKKKDGKKDGKDNVASVPVGGVAGGDGGAMVAAGTGGMAATGIGMLGIAALGGTALLRRRGADDSVA